MHPITSIPLFLLPFAALASSTPPQHVFSNPPFELSSTLAIPTIHESAVQARRILHLSSIATLSTVFPSPIVAENRPGDLAGAPIGLMDYYASCSPNTYDPTMLAVAVATSFKNSAAGSNVTMSMRYHPPDDRPPSDDIYTYSPANMPRFSLVGYIERIEKKDADKWNLSGCFQESHPDAKAWFPGNKIHESWWGRLIVEEIYWIGGFGDRAYIGWIPVEEWRRVTEQEVQDCRLVGEEPSEERESYKAGL